MEMKIRSLARVAVLYAVFTLGLSAQTEVEALGKELRSAYGNWRTSMMKKDSASWQRCTSRARQVHVKNRLVSEQVPFPQGVFNTPAAPAAIDGLKLMRVSQKGVTAKATFFGAVDFGVGGKPTNNLLVVNFVNENGVWTYDEAEFVNLVALPDVRKKLEAGERDYLKNADFEASGKTPVVPIEVGPAQIIAKVYAFCPGRDVRVQINGVSKHQFTNSKAAEVVIGGAKLGNNEVQFSAKDMKGGTGKEAMTVRVYLMSRVNGIKPLKAFEYQVNEGEAVKPSGTMRFSVDDALVKKLQGK